MRKKFLNQPQHIIKSQRHAHNVFLEGENLNKKWLHFAQRKIFLSQINAEIFMLKKTGTHKKRRLALNGSKTKSAT